MALSGGDYATLTPSRNRLVRCRVSNYARIRRAYTPGVRWLGVGHLVAESHVFDAPHSGFLGFGNDGCVCVCARACVSVCVCVWRCKRGLACVYL